MKQALMIMTLVLTSFVSIPIHAQVPISPTASPKDRSIEDKYRSDEIERVRRGTVTKTERHVTRFPQIKEDFERIQLVNSKTLQTISFERPLDHRRISEAAVEIKKRATRLKSNLFPSEVKGRAKQAEQSEESQDLKSLLTELDKAIVSFVHNPMFENTRLVNPQDSLRAQTDLEKIINLSARARKKTR